MKMAVDKEKAKQLSALTKSLLEVTGTSYDEWLYEQQLSYVTSNSEILIQALNSNQSK
jgi:hypothetical protein